MADKLTTQIQKMFGFIVRKDKNSGNTTIKPGKYDYGTGEIIPIKMSSQIEQAYKNWISNLTKNEDIKNRYERYSDIDYMTLNSGIMFQAATILSQETISPNESGKVLSVYAKDKKVEKAIYEFFDKIGINNQVLESLGWDLVTYGDHFWIRNISEGEGITSITPIDVYEVSERIEFSATKELNKINGINSQMPSVFKAKFTDLVTALSNTVKQADYGSQFKKYLYGFSLKDGTILPPWAVSHFRVLSTRSEFAPYGRPFLIYALSLYRQLKSGQNLLAMARVAKFPKEVFTVTTDDSMSGMQKWEAINRAREQYQNLVSLDNGKEDFGVGSSIWTAKDLIEFSLKENNLDLGEIADIEMLEKDLITATGIPPDYLIQGGNGWGSSDKALLQQSKVFARNIHKFQFAVLEELTNLVKTQFVLTNQFDGYETDFELSLSFPVTEQSETHIDIQTKTMDFVNSVIENLQTALAVDELPRSVKLDILRKYAFFDAKDLDTWAKKVDSENAPDPDTKNEKLIRGLGRLNESIFREAYFSTKKSEGISEGVNKGRHFLYKGHMDVYEKALSSVLKPKRSKKI